MKPGLPNTLPIGSHCPAAILELKLSMETTLTPAGERDGISGATSYCSAHAEKAINSSTLCKHGCSSIEDIGLRFPESAAGWGVEKEKEKRLWLGKQ